MSKAIVEASKNFVTELLKDQLTVDHVFHDLRHTLEVRDAAIEIGTQMKVSSEALELLEIAALFHDVGYTQLYLGHEEASKEIAEKFLQTQNYPSEKLQKVLDIIGATRVDHFPENELEEIIKDSDLSNLGAHAYEKKMNALRHEWEVFKGEIYSDKQWIKLNQEFFKQHNYYTEAARDMFFDQKQLNLAAMKNGKKNGRKNDQVSKKAKPTAPIASSKSVQMMFKTSLRNHIDLTNLADNKANIMLSINTGVLVITIPLLPTYIGDSMAMVIPATLLLLTCIGSVIFATLATRPSKMTGLTNIEAVKSGRANLFFFGNFYKMRLGDYEGAMKTVIKDEEVMENAIIRDLYFLGKALGNKYRLLRHCYTYFMVGMTITVLSFALVKLIFNTVAG